MAIYGRCDHDGADVRRIREGSRGRNGEGVDRATTLIELMTAVRGLRRRTTAGLPQHMHKNAGTDGVWGGKPQVPPGTVGQVYRGAIANCSWQPVGKLMRVVAPDAVGCYSVAHVQPIACCISGGIALREILWVRTQPVYVAHVGWVPPVIHRKPRTNVLDGFHSALIGNRIDHLYIALVATWCHVAPGGSMRTVLRSAGRQGHEEVVLDNAITRGRGAPNQPLPGGVYVIDALTDLAGGHPFLRGSGGCCPRNIQEGQKYPGDKQKNSESVHMLMEKRSHGAPPGCRSH